MTLGIVVIAINLLISASDGPATNQADGYGAQLSNLEQEKLKIEWEKLKIAREKMAVDDRIERDKLALEEKKAAAPSWSIVVASLSIFIPLLVAIWTHYLQERSQFRAKAAEIVMNGRNPHAAINRARALKALFPKLLPDEFANAFDPNEFESTAQRSSILKLFVDHPRQRDEILKLWYELYNGDRTLIESIRSANGVTSLAKND